MPYILLLCLESRGSWQEKHVMCLMFIILVHTLIFHWLAFGVSVIVFVSSYVGHPFGTYIVYIYIYVVTKQKQL